MKLSFDENIQYAQKTTFLFKLKDKLNPTFLSLRMFYPMIKPFKGLFIGMKNFIPSFSIIYVQFNPN
jgi:hypothetical protein